jgi:hypothetical protein
VKPLSVEDGTPEDRDDEVDGRFIGAVCEYASTCDGPCAELTSHVELRMDPITQLGYCDQCVPLLDAEIRYRLERKENS